jgi:hypothetical protein
VAQPERPERLGDCEDEGEVRHRQKLRRARLYPACRVQGLALGASVARLARIAPLRPRCRRYFLRRPLAQLRQPPRAGLLRLCTGPRSFYLKPPPAPADAKVGRFMEAWRNSAKGVDTLIFRSVDSAE